MAFIIKKNIAYIVCVMKKKLEYTQQHSCPPLINSQKCTAQQYTKKVSQTRLFHYANLVPTVLVSEKESTLIA